MRYQYITVLLNVRLWFPGAFTKGCVTLRWPDCKCGFLNENTRRNPHQGSYHFADHHDIGPQVFVYSEDVKNSDVPEDDVDAIDDAAISHVGLRLQPQQEPKDEDRDSHQVCDVPVVLQPHVDLLLQLPRLGHQDLTKQVFSSRSEEKVRSSFFRDCKHVTVQPAWTVMIWKVS